jgi:hypothetical protein
VTGFAPHGMCLLWRRDLIALHVTGDALIATAYFAIPLLMGYLFWSRKLANLPHTSLSVWTAAFIFACGLTHLTAIAEIWTPLYYLSGWLKIVTGALSIIAMCRLGRAVSVFMRLVPLAPTPEQLAAAIRSLES